MFSMGNLTKLATGIGAVTGIITYYRSEGGKKASVLASYTDESFQPASPKWDHNWDWRASVRPVDENNNSDEPVTKPTATRHVILIRHGQYNLKGESDEFRILTELGRKQADYTGQRLKELDLPYTSLIMSTMSRAKETAEIIHKHLPHLKSCICPLLEEGAPIPPDPPTGQWRPPKQQFYQDGARIEAAYRKYFYRADPSQKCDTIDIIVCHANVIRYFVCRALQYPPHGWLRLSLRHASITWLSILPSGRVVLKYMGDAGHMPPFALTTS